MKLMRSDEFQRQLEQVGRKCNLRPSAILSSDRAPLLVEARRQLCLRMRERGWSLPRIGRALGARHHTTVLHLLRKGWTSENVSIPVPDESGIWAI
jgi:chromosomal replication initiation ATPase DnaA